MLQVTGKRGYGRMFAGFRLQLSLLCISNFIRIIGTVLITALCTTVSCVAFHVLTQSFFRALKCMIMQDIFSFNMRSG